MPKFNKVLKQLRGEMGISQQELANRIGISKSSINMYERGEREPGIETLELFADFFGVGMDYLLGKSHIRNRTYGNVTDCPDDENPYEVELRDAFDKYDVDSQRIIAQNLSEMARAQIRPIASKHLPLLGNVACGEPIFADETRETYIDVDSDIDADFCLTAKGDSMINARIFDGDILFVKTQPIVDNGEIAVVLIEDEATVKRVYYDRENNIITLVPENPMYKPMRYVGEQLNNIRILGKVVFGQYNL